MEPWYRERARECGLEKSDLHDLCGYVYQHGDSKLLDYLGENGALSNHIDMGHLSSLFELPEDQFRETMTTVSYWYPLTTEPTYWRGVLEFLHPKHCQRLHQLGLREMNVTELLELIKQPPTRERLH